MNPPQSSRRSSCSSFTSHHSSNHQQSHQTNSPQSSRPQTPPSAPSSPIFTNPPHNGQPYCSASNPNLNQASGIANEASFVPSVTSFNLQSNLNVSTFNLDDIKEESEIKELSVRQLKLILARNFVDFKGCVEREELIQKAILLWQNKQTTNKLRGNFIYIYIFTFVFLFFEHIFVL